MLQGFSEEQLMLVENNSSSIQQRDKEIAHIVRSINDLNEIFKDLAHMVVDQVGITLRHTWSWIR